MKSLNFIKYALFIFFTQLLITYASVSYAADPTPSASLASPNVTGHVIWVKGSLKGQIPNADSRTLKRDSDVYEHDTLTTGAASEGKVSFHNINRILSLHENSIIKIDQYLRQGEKESSSFIKDILKSIRDWFRDITSSINVNEPGGIIPNPSQSVD